MEEPTFGPTIFEWEWGVSIPQEPGFEVRVWREGEPQARVHDAVLDNLEGNIEQIGGNQYRFSTDITNAPSVQGRSRVYLWTVSLVQVSPSYADLGQQSDVSQFRFDAPGGGSDGGGASGGGGNSNSGGLR